MINDDDDIMEATMYRLYFSSTTLLLHGSYFNNLTWPRLKSLTFRRRRRKLSSAGMNSSVNDRWLHGFSVVQNWLRVLRVGLAFYISGCAGHWRGPARRCCRDHCRGSAPGLCAVASGAARRGAVFVNIFTIQIHYTHFKYPPTSAMI